jgi:hypothetical protein
LAASASAGLDEHGVADAHGLFGQKGGLVVVAVVTGHQGHARLFHQRLGGRFAAHGGNGRRWWADEGDARIGTGLREGRVFGQEAIARVHRLRARGLGDFEDAVGAQVAVARRGTTNAHRLVASLHMLRVGIGIAVDRHGAHAHAASGGGHSAGNLAAVGNQDLLEHGVSRATGSAPDLARHPSAHAGCGSNRGGSGTTQA